MKFYSNDHPDKDQVTMCTVTDFDPVSGFRVKLDEYDTEGFLMLRDLHNRKIRVPVSSFLKVGTQLPLMVLESSSSGIYLSKKDVKSDMSKAAKTRFALNCRLFNTAKHLPEPESWIKSFREMCGEEDDEDEHLWTMIQNRQFNELDLSQDQVQVLTEHHAKIFGIKPCTQRMKFTVYSFGIDGNQQVKDVLMPLINDKVWTDQELYDDLDRYNLDIQPIAVPTFQVRISAYDQTRCATQLMNFKNAVNTSGLDHCVFQSQT